MTSTSRDVARAAGVSVATVSRAFSNGAVADATRRRVMVEAERLGYTPDPAARRLITGRSGNIGLIAPDIANPFFAEVMKGVQRRARESKSAIFISDTDEQSRLELEALHQLARQVDGLIWCSPRSPVAEVQKAAKTLPIVLTHRQIPGLWSVSADLASGMRQALANLAALGHRSVAYAAGPAESWSGQRRIDGLRAAAADLTIDLIELGHVSPTVEGGLVAADLVLATRATALIAYNDAVGLGAMSRLASRGVSVPGDLSVVGCDNTSVSQMTTPQLTTVNVPRFEAGDMAVTLLQQLMAAPGSEPVQYLLPTALMIRGTTAPPRA